MQIELMKNTEMGALPSDFLLHFLTTLLGGCVTRMAASSYKQN